MSGAGSLLSGKAMVVFNGGKVSNNVPGGNPWTSSGITALNDSMICGPSPVSDNKTATVEGNSASGFDLACDASSMIINADLITGAGQTRSCANIKGAE